MCGVGVGGGWGGGGVGVGSRENRASCYVTVVPLIQCSDMLSLYLFMRALDIDRTHFQPFMKCCDSVA